MAISKDASGKVDKKFALRQVQNACMCECRRGGWWCQSGRKFWGGGLSFVCLPLLASFGFLLQFVTEVLCLPLPLFRLIGCN